MEKKESYRLHLQHYQQPGNEYFVTWCLKASIPPKALERYTLQLQLLRHEISQAEKQGAEKVRIDELMFNYWEARRLYHKAYEDLLNLCTNPVVNLSNTACTEIIKESLFYFEGKKLENYAFCIMPNHIHWVFHLKERDADGQAVYLQDVMQSVKRFTANQINKAENRTGTLWQAENFDVTIRNREHLHRAVQYTINNPVKAGLVTEADAWPGTWVAAFLRP